MGMVLLALRGLRIPCQHVFASEIDPETRATLLANSPPAIMYHDIRVRPTMQTPAVDLYVAGFPCQPFSLAGRCAGFDSPNNGTIFAHILNYISCRSPRVFVLENVAGAQK